MKKILPKLCVVLVIAAVCFLLLNVVAHWAFTSMRSTRLDLHRGEYFVAPTSAQGIALLRRNLELQDVEVIRALAEGDPGIRPHPVLHFSTGRSRPFYNVGIDGMRYEPGWTDRQVREWLSETPGHTFVFGGSTTFGHGVPDDQTLVAQMNKSREQQLFLNFGGLAYDSIREVDKLLYLLRKGYRPSHVIFIDGLNDVITFAQTPYPSHDKPWMQGLLMDRGQVPLIFGYPRRRNMIQSLAFAFPVVQLAHRLATEARAAKEYVPVFLDDSDIEWQELVHFFENWDHRQVDRRRELAEELAIYYSEKISFVRSLGSAFGFESTFIFQPIGFLEERQPFVKEAFLQSRVARIYRTVEATVQNAILESRLEMVDCSRAILQRDAVATGYVDATHYSPSGNAILAECILKR